MKTVLIAEDNGLLANLWSRALQDQSVQIKMAGNGEDVLELATRDRPDLILMDIMMPRLDGLEVYRRIKSQYPADPPPVIFISCLARSSDMEEAHRLQALDFLVKGRFTLEYLVGRIRQVINNPRQERSPQ